MTENNDTATLTQRRSMSGASKLDKSKISSNGVEEQGWSSPTRIIAGIVVVVIIAVIAWFLVDRFVVNNQDNNDSQPEVTETPTPTPTPDPLEAILLPGVLSDTSASALQAESKFVNNDQAIGEVTEDNFVIEDLSMQRYDSFLRTKFLVSSDGEDSIPETTAEYDSLTNTIRLTINNVVADNSELGYDQTGYIDDSVVTSITHQIQSGEIEEYLFELSSETKFVLHSLTEGLENYIILDIAEVTEVVITPSVTDTPDEDVEPTTTVTPTKPAGENLTNDFSKSTQYIATPISSNSVGISGYYFEEIGSTFTYTLRLAGGDQPYPNSVATLEDTTLTLEISNLAYDGLPDNTGKGFTDFSEKGVDVAKTLDITFAKNKSTYVFELAGNYEYKLFVDEENNTLNVQVKR